MNFLNNNLINYQDAQTQINGMTEINQFTVRVMKNFQLSYFVSQMDRLFSSFYQSDYSFIFFRSRQSTDIFSLQNHDLKIESDDLEEVFNRFLNDFYSYN